MQQGDRREESRPRRDCEHGQDEGPFEIGELQFQNRGGPPDLSGCVAGMAFVGPREKCIGEIKFGPARDFSGVGTRTSTHEKGSPL